MLAVTTCLSPAATRLPTPQLATPLATVLVSSTAWACSISAPSFRLTLLPLPMASLTRSVQLTRPAAKTVAPTYVSSAHLTYSLTNNFNLGPGRSCQRRSSLHCSQQPSLGVSPPMAMHTSRYRGIVASLWPLHWISVTPVWRPSSLYLLVIGCLSTVIAGINCIIILSDGGGLSGLRKWIVNNMYHSADLHSLSGSLFTDTL